ncbi:HalOD1 output domain-containing protein [Halobaculum rarum]|uniref:HalOD1 output domain-containing protein n=1 Tax=Halobaculum rarum TaxID=3075122 RepID=UPI0032AEF3AF
MSNQHSFYYEPDEDELLSTAVVTAVAEAHDEDVLAQEWLISDDINTDALDGLFNKHNLKTTLQFEADSTTVTITADESGNPRIRIESHR